MHALPPDSSPLAADDARTDTGAVLPSVEPRTLTKAELADLLFEAVGLNKREAKDLVETFFDEIRDALARGEPVATPKPAKSSP
jgi:integration host factor subunit alpha